MIYLTMWSNAVAWKKYRIYASVGKLHISSCRSGVWFKILIYSLGFTGDWKEKTKHRDGIVDGHRFSCTAWRSYGPRQRAVLMDAVANETKLYRGIVRRVWQTRKGRGGKKRHCYSGGPQDRTTAVQRTTSSSVYSRRKRARRQKQRRCRFHPRVARNRLLDML